MKNKVLSALLAVCLFVGLAVPALAAYGTPADVAKIEFDKEEYDLADVTGIDLTTLLTAYDSHGNRTNFDEKGDTSVQVEEWYSSYENVLKVMGDQLQVVRSDVGTSDLKVKLTVKTTTEKQASTTIVVPKEASAAPNAIGFHAQNTTLENTQDSWIQYDKLIPVLKDSAFTATQKANFAYAVKLPGTTSWIQVPTTTLQNGVPTGDGASINGISFVAARDDAGMVNLYFAYTGKKVDSDAKYDELVASGALTPEAAEKYKNVTLLAGESIRVRVLGRDGFPSTQKDKEFAISIVNPAKESELKLPISINVNVGQILDLTSLNETLQDVTTSWMVKPYGSYQTDKEAGQIAKILVNNKDRYELKGLAEGVVNVELDVPGYQSKFIKVNVGDGVANTPKISGPSTVAVGSQINLEAIEIPQGAYVKWSVSNNNVQLNAFEGSKTTVYGKKEGTVKVTARVYNAKENGDLLATVDTTITVTAASSGSGNGSTNNGGSGNNGGSTTTPSQNPQTGDHFFANLF